MLIPFQPVNFFSYSCHFHILAFSLFIKCIVLTICCVIMQTLKYAILKKEQNRPDRLFQFTVTCAHLPSKLWLTPATDVLCSGPGLACCTHMANYTPNYTTFYKKYILFDVSSLFNIILLPSLILLF